MRTRPSAALLIGALLLTACGVADARTTAPGSPGDPPPAADCAATEPDCVDTIDVVDAPDVIEPADPAYADGAAPDTVEPPDPFDADGARDAARATIGLAEDQLDPDVRVSRRGDEWHAVTEDYVIGRLTVELDPDAAGVFRVTTVVVELPDGPETVTG